MYESCPLEPLFHGCLDREKRKCAPSKNSFEINCEKIRGFQSLDDETREEFARRGVAFWDLHLIANKLSGLMTDANAPFLPRIELKPEFLERHKEIFELTRDHPEQSDMIEAHQIANFDYAWKRYKKGGQDPREHPELVFGKTFDEESLSRVELGEKIHSLQLYRKSNCEIPVMDDKCIGKIDFVMNGIIVDLKTTAALPLDTPIRPKEEHKSQLIAYLNMLEKNIASGDITTNSEPFDKYAVWYCYVAEKRTKRTRLPIFPIPSVERAMRKDRKKVEEKVKFLLDLKKDFYRRLS